MSSDDSVDPLEAIDVARLLGDKERVDAFKAAYAPYRPSQTHPSFAVIPR
jgi:hypothetical protein